MYLTLRYFFKFTAFAGLILFSTVVLAVKIEPGAGVGIEYTDNVALSESGKVGDTIKTGYVGVSLADNEGALQYNAVTSFNNHSYTQDAFPDQHYFSLGANADWAMMRDRINWNVSDTFQQRTVNTFSDNTPDNLQDSNIFVLGANINYPLAARQNISLIPSFSQYYYEVQTTDNKQYSLAINWNYQMFRLTNVGLNLSSRKINYIENTLAGTRFSNAAFIVSGSRQHSSYSVNLGSTNVKRDGGDGTSGFSGNINWLMDLSSRSKINAVASTELTDASSAANGASVTPGDSAEIQITSDVIRNKALNVTYSRIDSTLSTTISVSYRKVEYSDNSLNNSEIRAINLNVNYPVTQRLMSSLYTSYDHTKRLTAIQIDKRYTVGGNLRYKLSRKWHSLFDIKYREKESTDTSQNYNEWSVFASLVYGFGDVQRATRAGGF